MLRIARPIGPFWWAKGRSTRARTADLAAFVMVAFVMAARFGIGLPVGFL